MIHPCPKPVKREKKQKQKTTARSKQLKRELDALCAMRVKALAMFRCECGCNRRPSDINPLDWAHGDGRAQVWALRWAHSNGFALLRSCHERFGRDPKGFRAWRRSMVHPKEWDRIVELERTRPHVGYLGLLRVRDGFARGEFVQGERDARTPRGSR